MELHEIQSIAKACLAANTELCGIELLAELDETATAEELAAYEQRFETALATRGLCLVVLQPFAMSARAVTESKGGELRSTSAVLDMAVPVAICENEEINRGPAQPNAAPPILPHGKRPSRLIAEILSALMTRFQIPAQPVGRPQFDEGFWAYYLVAQTQCKVRRMEDAS